MYYNGLELIENFNEKISNLGIDPNFKENPAYEKAVYHIRYSIYNMLLEMFSHIGDAKFLSVHEEEGKISFDYQKPTEGKKWSVSILSPNPEALIYISCKEDDKMSIDGQYAKEKFVLENVATMDKSTGSVTLIENSSRVDNKECSPNRCNNRTSASREIFSSDGISVRKEMKWFPSALLDNDFEHVPIDSVLYIPRQAFDFGQFRDMYVLSELYLREKLDTARKLVEDKETGIKYRATIPLNQEHGLSDMIPIGGDPYPQEIVIPPLSQEQIEEMIQKETNSKVAEGLRKYAVGRNTYSYNSLEDKDFISEGIAWHQNTSK